MTDRSVKPPADRPNGLLSAFLEHSGFLARFLSRYLSRPQDIEDIIQETYLRASGVSLESQIDRPKAFLFTIARNLALNELGRKSQQMTQYIEDAMPATESQEEASAEDQVIAQQSLDVYCEALATLPEQCRRIYLLRHVHGLKHGEIAQRLGVSLSTVEKNLSKGLLSCQAYIRRANDGTARTARGHSAARLGRWVDNG